MLQPGVEMTDFFVYSRAAPGAGQADHGRELDEAHWSYMDRYADGMIARGPTLAPDRETWTGSLHILALPSAEAAREFVEREPYNRAGLFAQHAIRPFENLLGRTMWEFPGSSDDPRFLVFTDVPVSLPRERLIVHGRLRSPAGFVCALQAPTREDVARLVAGEILDWEFGGRR
jgi:uncharacterized protein YciI